MSLNYDYIFSQIDKAKKKKRKRWTQADTDAAAKKLAEDKEARGPVVSQRRYVRNPGGKNKPSLHRGTLSDMKLDEKTDRVTGSGSSGVGTPFKDEKQVPKGGRATNVGTYQAAHSSGTLTNTEREEKKQKKESFYS